MKRYIAVLCWRICVVSVFVAWLPVVVSAQIISSQGNHGITYDLNSSVRDITSHWFKDGKFIEESDSQKMTNDFGGRLDFTDNIDFLNNWRHSWTSVQSVQHQDAVCIVLFVACKYEVEDQDFVYDLTIKRPDGTVCNSFTNLTAFKENSGL